MLKSWISCSCGYKFPQTWWPKTRKPYSSTVLEAGSLKFRSEQSCVPSEGSEEDCLRVSSSFWWWLSCSVVSNSLRPHGLQHTRIPCSLPSPGVCSNSCPLSQWCHSTISSSVVPFSSRLQSFPASGSFPVSWLFVSGSQSIRVSASASVLPMDIQGWSPLGWTGWIISSSFWRLLAFMVCGCIKSITAFLFTSPSPLRSGLKSPSLSLFLDTHVCFQAPYESPRIISPSQGP